MKKEVSVLIIDNHPMCIDGYKNVLEKLKCTDNPELLIDTANDIDSGLKYITNRHHSHPYDLIIMDIKLPVKNETKITTGMGLAILAQSFFPDAKMVVLSSIEDNVLIQSIIKDISPNALLIKKDLTPEKLTTALSLVAHGQTYYSHTVNTILRKKIQNDYTFDLINLKILYGLSQGIKTKDLTSQINLSLSAIEKRKSYIKSFLGIDSGGDAHLLKEARRRGLI